MQKFTLKAEHIGLLKRANVDWCDDEFGAPAIDPKRPYGNSSVYQDIAKTLGITPASEGGFSDEQTDLMNRLHGETQTALQIILSTGKFEAGKYEAEDYTDEWHKVAGRSGS